MMRQTIGELRCTLCMQWTFADATHCDTCGRADTLERRPRQPDPVAAVSAEKPAEPPASAPAE